MGDPILAGATRVRPSTGTLSRVLDGEAVLLGTTTARYYGLDPVGTHIWSLVGAGEDLDGVGLRGGLALLPSDERGESVGLFEHHVAQPKQVAPALGEGEARPGRECGSCRFESGPRLVAVKQAGFSEGPAVGGAHGRSAAPVARNLAETDDGVMQGKADPRLGVRRRCGGGRHVY